MPVPTIHPAAAWLVKNAAKAHLAILDAIDAYDDTQTQTPVSIDLAEGLLHTIAKDPTMQKLNTLPWMQAHTMQDLILAIYTAAGDAADHLKNLGARATEGTTTTIGTLQGIRAQIARRHLI